MGGVIQSVRRDGYLAEFGPNSILETSPVISDLVRELGLESRRLYSEPSAEKRYVVRGKKPVEIPNSAAGFLTTPLFSLPAKLRVLAEPFIRPAPEGVEESIAQFVQRRLGQEFLDYAIDPLVAGIYAGRPANAFRDAGLSQTARAGATLSFAFLGANPGRARTQAQRRGFQAGREEVFLR